MSSRTGLAGSPSSWSGDGLIGVYLQNPDATGPADRFFAPLAYASVGTPGMCAILDMDGDGRQDLVVCSLATATLQVYYQR